MTNADDPVPPEEFGGLPVADIGRVLETRAGSPPGTVVAISGFLRVDGAAAGGCADEPPGSLGPWCERLGILAAQPPTSRSSSTCRIASHRHLSPHLHLSIPAGVRLPQAVEAAGQESVDDGAQVLVIGRFAPAAATCVRAPWGCGETFVVERFAWVDGVRVGPTPLIADALQTGTRHVSPFGMVLGAGDLPLAAVLSWPDDIARLDPDAAALAEAGRPGEPVWYVRVLEGSAAPGGERPVRWMLLADRDFHVIGSFHEPATTADPTEHGFGMIVQPTPTNPRSPIRRALRVIGLTMPPLLLVIVVGAGLAGPKPEPAVPDASQLAVAPSLPAPPADSAVATARRGSAPRLPDRCGGPGGPVR